MLGLMPFWKFQQDDHIEDVHLIDVTELARDQVYTLVVGLYAPANDERLLVTLPNGTQPVDRAVGLGAVTIGAEACR
jgi:hypothetical protein